MATGASIAVAELIVGRRLDRDGLAGHDGRRRCRRGYLAAAALLARQGHPEAVLQPDL